jgi:AcrR family transcriptional regulator
MPKEPDPNPPPGLDLIWLRGERDRRPQPPLSREQIVRAAIAIADEEGIDAVSMRRIASRLGSGATSLYWYVDRKDDLFELMFDACTGEIELPEPAEDLRAALRHNALETRAMVQRHPWIPQIGIQPGLGPNTRRYGEHWAAAFQPLGVPLETMTAVLAVLNNYVFGFGHREASWSQTIRRSGRTPAQWRRDMHRYVDEVVIPQDPELGRHIASRLDLTSDENFEFGLDCLLDGLTARLESMPGGTTESTAKTAT